MLPLLRHGAEPLPDGATRFALWAPMPAPSVSISATAIILVILAGVKPIERRLFTLRQRREIRLIADRGSVTVRALEQTLGSSSNRIKKFVVQPPEHAAVTDDISIALARVSNTEFQSIRNRLLQLKGVRECSDSGNL